MDSVHIALFHLEVFLQQEAVSVVPPRGDKVWLSASSQAYPGVETLHQLQDAVRPLEQHRAVVYLLTASQSPGDHLDVVVVHLQGLHHGHVGEQGGVSSGVAEVADRKYTVVFIEGK